MFFIDRRNRRARGEAFRELTNSSVQGSAADLIKLAGRDIMRERNRLASEDDLWGQVKFISQIHDEILMEVPEEIATDVKDMVVSKMESVVKLRRGTPLSANAGTGRTWQDAH